MSKMGMIDTLYQKDTWGKNDGSVVAVKDMSVSHIKNTVSWIWRNREQLKMGAEAEMAFAGPALRGEAARDAFDDAFGEMLNKNENDWFCELPIIEAFREELINRGEESTSEWLTRMINNRRQDET